MKDTVTLLEDKRLHIQLADVKEYTDKETGNFLIEKLYDLINDHDVIIINELNDYQDVKVFDYLLSDGEDVYFLTSEDLINLSEKGEAWLVRQGHVNEFIDKSNPEHIDFLKWLNHE